MQNRAYRFDDVFPDMIPVSRSKGWELIREGKLRVKRAGRVVIIPDESVREFLAASESEIKSAK